MVWASKFELHDFGFEVWASGVKLASFRLQAPGKAPSTAAEMIDEAVRYFNEERILLKLGGLSPGDFGAKAPRKPMIISE